MHASAALDGSTAVEGFTVPRVSCSAEGDALGKRPPRSAHVHVGARVVSACRRRERERGRTELARSLRSPRKETDSRARRVAGAECY